jgi:hypothetical protein
VGVTKTALPPDHPSPGENWENWATKLNKPPVKKKKKTWVINGLIGVVTIMD